MVKDDTRDKRESFNDQLKEHFFAKESNDRNGFEDDVNKSLSKEFEKWLEDDKKDSAKPKTIGASLKKNKDRFSKHDEETEPKRQKESAHGILSGMESRRIYEQLTPKQKKEIAWLLREDGLV
jgi:hypothetical protein